MKELEYLEAIRGDSEAFLNAAGPALDHPIDHLGDWTMRDLVTHLGHVYSLVIANITDPGTDRVAPGAEANAPDGDRLTEWFAERRATLLEGLQRADADTEVWTFAGTKTVGWWLRRMASETSVHRWDSETILGDGPGELDSDLAKDSIDEYTEVGLRHSSKRPIRVYPETTLHLHRTDGPGEWMFAAAPTKTASW